MINLTPSCCWMETVPKPMAFYRSCLNGDLTVTRVADMPMKNQMHPEQHHTVADAHLKSGAIEFSATDWLHPTPTPKPGNTVAMYIAGGQYYRAEGNICQPRKRSRQSAR